MSESGEGYELLSVTVRPATMRMRVNVAKQSKGYVHDTTVEVTWENDTDDEDDYLVTMGDAGSMRPDQVLAHLLRVADNAARAEIAEREALDRNPS